MKTCETCRFWEQYDDNVGSCVVNPPVVVDALVASYCGWAKDNGDFDMNSAIEGATSWPSTISGDRCGKHEEKR